LGKDVSEVEGGVMSNVYSCIGLDKYYIGEIICSSECGFRFPVPLETEQMMQKILLPGMLHTEIEMAAINQEMAHCPSCNAPTILRIMAIGKNG
jgi:hypothetical protein